MEKSTKHTINILVTVAVVILAIKLLLLLLPMLGSPNFGFIEEINDKYCFFRAEIDELMDNVIKEDAYGRVLISTGNIADLNPETGKECIIVYSIHVLNEHETLSKHIPKVYYYVAYEDNTDSEGFKQFLQDNHWGENPRFIDYKYKSYGYPTDAIDKQLLDSHGGIDDSIYYTANEEYIQNTVDENIVLLKHYNSRKNYVIIGLYVNPDDHKLYAVATDYNDLDNVFTVHKELSYDKLVQDIEDFKEQVDYEDSYVFYDSQWNTKY